ncbi:MAG: hypothetical protein JOZ54_25485 [Acidobacteria bacterium]|nr:hypothetical protein [Acidobacteriota bacterium]
MKRGWLWVTTLGLVVVILAMIVAMLALFDKPHFESIVGAPFIMALTSGLIIGSLAMFVGSLFLSKPKTWRDWTLLAWSLVGLTSPALGYLFLLPWALMGATLPLVIWILAGRWRG